MESTARFRGGHVRASATLDPFEGLEFRGPLAGAQGYPDRVGRRTKPPVVTELMSTDELLAEALRLSRGERARVAEELLSSLEEPDYEVAAAWATELERRSRDVAEGRVQTTRWETASAGI